MTEEVGVRLELRDRLRFSREMDQAGDSVDRFQRRAALGANVLSGVNRVGSRTAGVMGSVARGAGRAGLVLGKGLAIGAGAAAVGMGVLAKKSVDAYMEAERVTAQTKAVIDSTGGVANVTVAEIGAMATEIQELSGISDETTASASNVLLTFKKVRNEVGAGNDIFDQGVTSIANMSTALGKDMNSSAIMVGKVLNDPIKGITALTRAGVQFTEGQTEQIAKMVESGNLMGAQKTILAELETQFGGSAAAMGKTAEGQMNIAKNAVGDAMERIGARILPVVTNILPDLTKSLVSVFDTAGPVIEKVAGTLGKTLGPVMESIGPLLNLFADLFGEIAKAVAPVIEMLGGIFTRVLRTLMPAIKPLLTALTDGLLLVFKELRPVLPTLAQSLAKILVALTPLIPPFAKLVALMAKIGVEVLAAVLPPLAGLAEVLAGAVAWALENVLIPLVEFLSPIATNLGKMFGKLVEWLRGPFEWVIKQLQRIIGWAKSAIEWISGVLDKISNLQDKVIEAAVQGIEIVVEEVTVRGNQSPSGRARGGRVLPNIPYIVGERRPEVFMPDSPGVILPDVSMAMAGAGGTSVHIGQVVLPGVTNVKQFLQDLRNEAAKHG